MFGFPTEMTKELKTLTYIRTLKIMQENLNRKYKDLDAMCNEVSDNIAAMSRILADIRPVIEKLSEEFADMRSRIWNLERRIK